MAKIGDLCEIRGELTIEWKIKNFMSLSDGDNTYYDSQTFYFSGASWELRIYPNGQTENESDGWLGLYLMRKSIGSPVTLHISFAIKKSDGNKDDEFNIRSVTIEKKIGNGLDKMLLRSALMERKTELIPSDELTIICTLKNNGKNAVTGSLFHRQKDVCDNLTELWIKKKRTDSTLKFNGKGISAHRMILETRSSVFEAMFNHDTKENRTGEIFIDDVDANTMDTLLSYMYCGDMANLTTDSVLSLYAAADKYDIKDVKEICSEFIIRNLSVEWVCEVIKFAELYAEEEMRNCATEFFKENADKILETDAWKTFVRESNDIAVDLLSIAVKTLFRK